MLSPVRTRQGIGIREIPELILDPTRKPLCGVVFISHPHSDHHPTSIKRGTQVVASESTFNILTYKLKTILNHRKKFDTDQYSIRQIPSGHMHGATSAIIRNGETGEAMIYTGDINDRTRFGLKGYQSRKADVLVIEATYGHPKYVFPDTEELMFQAYEAIESFKRSGKQVLIHTYSLGKAQILLMSPIAELIDGIHPQIHTYNRLFSKEDFTPPDIPAKSTLDNSGVFLIPRKPAKNNRTNVVNVFFTGWALNSFHGKNLSFPLSDHADYYGLLEIVKKTDPERVYTVFGYHKEFAAELRKRGYNAESLESNQARIDGF